MDSDEQNQQKENQKTEQLRVKRASTLIIKRKINLFPKTAKTKRKIEAYLSDLRPQQDNKLPQNMSIVLKEHDYSKKEMCCGSNQIENVKSSASSVGPDTVELLSEVVVNTNLNENNEMSATDKDQEMPGPSNIQLKEEKITNEASVPVLSTLNSSGLLMPLQTVKFDHPADENSCNSQKIGQLELVVAHEKCEKVSVNSVAKHSISSVKIVNAPYLSSESLSTATAILQPTNAEEQAHNESESLHYSIATTSDPAQTQNCNEQSGTPGKYVKVQKKRRYAAKPYVRGMTDLKLQLFPRGTYQKSSSGPFEVSEILYQQELPILYSNIPVEAFVLQEFHGKDTESLHKEVHKSQVADKEISEVKEVLNEITDDVSNNLKMDKKQNSSSKSQSQLISLSLDNKTSSLKTVTEAEKPIKILEKINQSNFKKKMLEALVSKYFEKLPTQSTESTNLKLGVTTEPLVKILDETSGVFTQVPINNTINSKKRALEENSNDEIQAKKMKLTNSFVLKKVPKATLNNFSRTSSNLDGDEGESHYLNIIEKEPVQKYASSKCNSESVKENVDPQTPNKVVDLLSHQQQKTPEVIISRREVLMQNQRNLQTVPQQLVHRQAQRLSNTSLALSSSRQQPRVLENTIVIDPASIETTIIKKPVEQLLADEANYNVSVKLLWDNQIDEIHIVKKHEKFQNLISKLADRETCDPSSVVLMFGDRVIHASDTPDSIQYHFTKKITGRIVEDLARDNVKQKNWNLIRVKIQSENLKNPLKLKIDKTQKFSCVIPLIVEAIKAPEQNIKLKFDGDLIDLNLSPNDLEIAGGEIIDCIVSKN